MSEFGLAHIVDLIGFAVSVLVFVAYQLYLGRRTRLHPESSEQDALLAAREAWVASVMRDRRDILAVQTFRNSIMSASFMASTSVLLIIGVLTLSAQGDKLSGTWHSLNFLGHVDGGMWLFKLLVMLFDLLFAFFTFAMAVRLFHHVGYSINVPLNATSQNTQILKVTAQLNRAGSFYRLGMRTYYVTVPLLFWLFGTLWLVGATTVLIYFLYHFDRTPRSDNDLMG